MIVLLALLTKITFAIVVDKHRAVDVAPQVARLVREGSGGTVAREQVVSAASGRGAHVEASVPVDDFGRIGHGCRLVGRADVVLGPLHEVLRAPAIDVAVAGADVEIVVASVLHDVGVAQATVLQSGQNHRVGPALGHNLGTGSEGHEQAKHQCQPQGMYCFHV